MNVRRKTRQIIVGDTRHGSVRIGGGSPVSVQSMTTARTCDIDKCVSEINSLAEAGADTVRVAVPHREDAMALREVLGQVSVPLVADVHFHFKRALEAIEAGVHKIRLNPGNIDDRNEVKRVIDACRERGVPIRIGVNEGSVVERKEGRKRMSELEGLFSEARHGRLMALMITKLEEYIEIFEACDFHDIVISAKTPDPVLTIDVYTEIAERFDYPLHLGVTHAGPRETGMIRSCVPMGVLLANGIGDTIRISYASDSVYEVRDGIELLCCLGLRQRQGVGLVACPTCSRVQVDMLGLVEQIREKLEKYIHVPMRVAVMGCVVNGPGEAEGADVAVFCGKDRGVICVGGKKGGDVCGKEIPDELLGYWLEYPTRRGSGEEK